MRILIVTVVHTPADARIARRQITALLDDGWQVSFAAPWSAFGIEPPDEVVAIDLPRAAGRRRLRAFRAARRLLRRQAGSFDVVLIHDPELLLAVWTARVRTPVIWDVHEDAAASLIDDRLWVPRWCRGAARTLVRSVERRAEGRCSLILAEESYADRFRNEYQVIRNVPPVPARAPDVVVSDRVVQVGRVSRLRGALELIELGRCLANDGIRVEVIGAADADVAPALEAAAADGVVKWHGFLPNEQALRLVDGAIAGLSLLHDVPNYRGSLPTKVIEYLSRGVPVISTPLPAARAVVQDHDVGEVVPFGAVERVAEVVRAFKQDPVRHREMAKRAYQVARDRYAWQEESRRFLAAVAAAAKREPV